MQSNHYETLKQVSSEDIGQISRDHLSGFVRQMIGEVMAGEDLIALHSLNVQTHFIKFAKQQRNRELVSQYSQQTDRVTPVGKIP